MSRPFLALSRPCLLFRVGRGWPVAGRRGLVRSRGRLADLASLARITGLPVRTGLADLASLARITGLPVRTGIIRPGARIRHCRYQVLERAYGILNHGGKDPPGAG